MERSRGTHIECLESSLNGSRGSDSLIKGSQLLHAVLMFAALPPQRIPSFRLLANAPCRGMPQKMNSYSIIAARAMLENSQALKKAAQHRARGPVRPGAVAMAASQALRRSCTEVSRL